MGNYDYAVLKLIHHTGIINLIILEKNNLASLCSHGTVQYFRFATEN